MMMNSSVHPPLILPIGIILVGAFMFVVNCAKIEQLGEEQARLKEEMGQDGGRKLENIVAAIEAAKGADKETKANELPAGDMDGLEQAKALFNDDNKNEPIGNIWDKMNAIAANSSDKMKLKIGQAYKAAVESRDQFEAGIKKAAEQMSPEGNEAINEYMAIMHRFGLNPAQKSEQWKKLAESLPEKVREELKSAPLVDIAQLASDLRALIRKKLGE